MSPRIAIIGGGLGGSTAGVSLQRAGFDVQVYEQAAEIQRVGAGIQLQANTMRVLAALDLDKPIRDAGVPISRWQSRVWDTGDIIFEPKGLSDWVVVHRADLLNVLLRALKPGTLHSRKRLEGLDQKSGCVNLMFTDGTSAEADIVVGADGINSRVRELLLGAESPQYSGYIAYRSIFSSSLVHGHHAALDQSTKWWSDQRHWDPAHTRYFLTYPLSQDSDDIYFVTGAPESNWNGGTHPTDATKDEVKACYTGFHPEVHALIDAAPAITKWPVFVRKPLPVWSDGSTVLLGDACHPMSPYMGQGAGMAFEDAAILTRCLQAHPTNPRRAFDIYRQNRIDRTSLIQRVSSDHTWLAYPQETDWALGYDASTCELRT
ncbi:FAD-dependent monooxygenase [Eoetvoesiella caeni]